MTKCPNCNENFQDGYNMVTIEAIDKCLECANKEFPTIASEDLK
jgi:predicted  nucleic acid-binding Zn-ribbon protein